MKVTAILLLFLIYFASLSATIINIPEDYSTIQEGITLSVQGDTVLVAPGTYVENINYSGKNITVASLFHTTQDTSYISQTIIDGDSIDSVVTFESGEDSTAVLTGFSITNGSNFHGGGIHCYGYSNPILGNIRISGNSANYGGGISIVHYSNPILENVTISDNTAFNHGGGISIGYYSSPILENVTIADNFGIEGGGITCYGSNPILANVAITNNSGWDASGIYCRNSNPILINVTLEGNADNFGSSCGICCWDNSNPILINCIMWNERTVEIKFFDLYQPNTITIANSDIEGGIEAINTNNNGTVNWLEGNIDVYPLFINTIIGDYHLQDTSLCIGAGINEIEINEIWYYSPDFDIEGNLRPSPEGSMPDMGAYENILGEPQVGTFDDLTFTINYLYNFPNPFNPTTTIFFNLSEVEKV
ncbi:MAG: right-handed parallel beta-helix repeat-containing protein [Candidatus Tenebribacter davisii]|nr:right-handed parallel beta-helix repeat-containing protein [Candidatus Tenebribacter davisii]